jgi:hypothetical protein
VAEEALTIRGVGPVAEARVVVAQVGVITVQQILAAAEVELLLILSAVLAVPVS